MSKRLIITPRMSGDSQSDWYPWLTHRLEAEASRPFAPIIALDLPTPRQPIVAEWTAGVVAALGTDPAEIARTVLIGHSVGCLANLHALESLPDGVSVYGALFVAAWWTVDEPWDTLMPWITTPIDLARVRAAAGKCVVLVSDNDPFIADQHDNRRAWQQKMGASVLTAPGAEHFNAAHQPAVLQAVVEQFG